tara:strand:+ start:7131 stop:8003 length:873 start_codon:yes stop_codon:yes gene_type:complete
MVLIDFSIDSNKWFPSWRYAMCRWLAYSGPAIHLDDVLLRPEHSLIAQSKKAWESTLEVNGDGFGIGWYTDRQGPGVYRDTFPAWNDWNLASIAAHLSSPLFLGHVRAAVGSQVSRSNCHPFRSGKWLFQHNGAIAEFNRIKHQLDMQIHPDLYAQKIGQTDSETMFLLALTFGLEKDAARGIGQMIEVVEKAREEAAIEDSFHMTIATTDGETLHCARHASFGSQPSLYHSKPDLELQASSGDPIRLQKGAILVVSEPLDELAEDWQIVPESSRLVIKAGDARIHSLST